MQPQGYRRSIGSRWLPWLAAAFVTVLALLAIAWTRGLPIEARQVEAGLVELQAEVHALNGKEARLDGGVSPRLKQGIADDVRSARALAERVRELETDPEGAVPQATLEPYVDAVLELVALVEVGRLDEAEELDEARVDPAYEILGQTLLGAAVERAGEARAVTQEANLLAGGAIVLMLAALVGLAWSESRRQRRTEAELLVRNESILNAAGEGIYGLDIEGRATFANPAAARMTGHKVEELIGRHSHELVHHTRPDGTHFPFEECPVFESLADATVHYAEDVYWRKDGSSFPVEYTSTPIVEQGEVKGAVVVFKNICERREIERAKDEFTSVVSHELRTPLTSIRGSLGLLESGVLGPLPEKGQRMIEIAVENTDRLVRLINDILDIERIDSGTIDMHKQRCEAADLIARAVDGLQSLAAQAQVRLHAHPTRAALLADPDRILQTLTNLISNAVKFSPPESTVQVFSERRDGEVVFRISDEGRGIPADKLDSVFERFQQVDASDAREKGGTGLGLAICRTIVEHHGGRIWVESVPEQGSTFSFAVPALAEHHPAHDDRAAPAGPTVLICDDDASLVEVTGAMLAERNYRVIETASGEQALERAIAERPDAILLDLCMPGMSGWETAAALRERPETSDIPIVILSGLSKGENENPSGPVVDRLEKPIDEEALFDALGRAVGSDGEPFKVLVVEDDPDLAGILSTVFERHGMEAFEASSGTQAIELSQQVLPDLLVLDVGLPQADGFEVVEWLRRHERLSALPMIVYTAHDLGEADRERLQLGDTTEFLTKGRISPADFERCVMALLARLTQDRIAEGDHEREAHPVG